MPAAKSAAERRCASDFKEEKDENAAAEFSLPVVKDERETLAALQPKDEVEEYDIKKKGLTDSASPLKKQRKISKDAGGEQGTLFSYFGKS